MPTSQHGHQLHVYDFNSTRDINLDSQNVISNPKLNAMVGVEKRGLGLVDFQCSLFF
jgi:hypothetical protein